MGKILSKENKNFSSEEEEEEDDVEQRHRKIDVNAKLRYGRRVKKVFCKYNRLSVCFRLDKF